MKKCSKPCLELELLEIFATFFSFCHIAKILEPLKVYLELSLDLKKENRPDNKIIY